MSISREQADREWEADLAIRPEPVEYWSDIAARDPAWCIASPDGKGPHRPDDTTDPVTCAECGATIDRWTVAEGRIIAWDGAPLFYVDGLRDERRGNLYQPHALDVLTRRIVELLNDARVDGSDVPMRVYTRED